MFPWLSPPFITPLVPAAPSAATPHRSDSCCPFPFFLSFSGNCLPCVWSTWRPARNLGPPRRKDSKLMTLLFVISEVFSPWVPLAEFNEYSVSQNCGLRFPGIYLLQGENELTLSVTSCCCSVNKLCPTLCDPSGLQHSMLPCPSLSPKGCSDSCPLSWWCCLTISSSVASFSSCPHSFPASGSFPVSQLFASGAQSIGVSPSASVLPIFRVDFL